MPRPNPDTPPPTGSGSSERYCAKDGGSVADAAAISQQIGEAEKRLQAQIDAAADRLRRQGADITMTGCDPIRGGVVVGLLELSEEARAAVDGGAGWDSEAR